jgi:hypothetical protein
MGNRLARRLAHLAASRGGEFSCRSCIGSLRTPAEVGAWWRLDEYPYAYLLCIKCAAESKGKPGFYRVYTYYTQ